MNRVNDRNKVGCLGILLAIVLIWAFAALVHHAGHSCPDGYIAGTPHWCK